MSNFMLVFTAIIIIFAVIGTIVIYLDNKKHHYTKAT
jgi:heme/copper-type cytochrome/quinol oxidase subunit 4